MTETIVRGTAPAGDRARRMVRVWDPLVRIFHWSLVAAVAIAWLTADEVQPVHEVAGYVVAGLLAFRVIWGIVGGRYARFGQFLRGPAETLSYMGDLIQGRERRYLGHNPAGAAMIVALLITLSGAAVTGWLMEEPSRITTPREMPRIVAPALAGDGRYERHGEGGEKILEELHEVLANLTLLLVALHVGGVVLASFRHNENLVRAMVTGAKRAPGPGDVA